LVDRSDRTTIGRLKQDVYYSDFLDDLKKHPATGLISRVVNENSVKQAVKNLILTGTGERFFQPNVGGNLRRLLFEPMDLFTSDAIKSEILQTIFNNEPRVASADCIVQPDESNNAYRVSVTFTIRTIQTSTTLEIVLQRVR